MLFSLIFPAQYIDILMANFLIGYLCYDYIHYATHHFPMTSPVGKYLRKYHLQHHYSGEDSKYGVSSPLWDYIFKTVSGPKSKH
jgi:sterol desaturase/sphingolipid hydroxylase (fatty acid hydroxylase superfamily)